ncbi:hypothetical protein AAVH_10073 [Aphelenchoides avenae]|nr:hypothetical protein AAVH_10073 [Aphelenchus avenae]
MSDSDTDVLFVCEVASGPNRPSTSGAQPEATEKFMSAFRREPAASKSKPVKSKAAPNKKKAGKPATARNKQQKKKQTTATNAVKQEGNYPATDRDSDVEIVDEVVPPTPVNNQQTATQPSEPPPVPKEPSGTDPVEGQPDPKSRTNPTVRQSHLLLASLVRHALRVMKLNWELSLPKELMLLLRLR